MIELKLTRTVLRWDFSFFAVLALFFSLDSSGFGLTALAICAVHELAHLAVMLFCGIIPESVTFYGAGIRITAPQTERHSPAEQAAVYGAGCVMNFLLAGALFAAGFPYPAAVSLSCGLFNMLPVGEFDGRRLLKLALIRTLPAERVDGVLRLCGIVSAALTAAFLLIAGGKFSPTLAITSAYLLLMSARSW